MVNDLCVKQCFVAWLTIECNDGHAPYPLAGDTPVRAVSDHIGYAFLTPCRDPTDLLNSIQRIWPEPGMVHGNKPLWGRSENDRIMATPAVWIRMSYLFSGQQRPARLEQFHDRLVGLKDVLSLE